VKVILNMLAGYYWPNG